jgi:hypothetical protein
MFFLWKLLMFQYFMTKTELYKLCQQNTYVVRNCITDGAKMPGAVPIVADIAWDSHIPLVATRHVKPNSFH